MLPHERWKEREQKMLEAARKVYSVCKHRDKSIDLEDIGVEIYDLMDEECWERYRIEEERIKKEYSSFEEK